MIKCRFRPRDSDRDLLGHWCLLLITDFHQALRDLIWCWLDRLDGLVGVKVEELTGHLLHVWEGLECHWHLRLSCKNFTLFKVELFLVMKVGVTSLPLNASARGFRFIG
jgi:hypothetical protein